MFCGTRVGCLLLAQESLSFPIEVTAWVLCWLKSSAELSLLRCRSFLIQHSIFLGTLHHSLSTSTLFHSNRPFEISEMPSIYDQQFDEFFALYEQGKYAECIELGERHLTDPGMSRYLSIKTHCILASSVEEWRKAEARNLSTLSKRLGY